VSDRARQRPHAADFTPRERAVIAAHRTPQQVQRWLRTLPYNRERDGETLRTFRGVLRHGAAHCLEGCLAAATILEQHGHPPLIVHLDSQDGLEHIVWVFAHHGRWGAIGRSRDEGLHGRAPVFPSLEALAASYHVPYVDTTGRVTGWAHADLSTLLPRTNWRLDARNVWSVDRALLRLRHRRLPMSERAYQTWKARYAAFKAEHPAPTARAWRRFYGDHARHWW
jgi:hypothetical protein